MCHSNSEARSVACVRMKQPGEAEEEVGGLSERRTIAASNKYAEAAKRATSILR